jgi:hypothetical protein
VYRSSSYLSKPFTMKLPFSENMPRKYIRRRGEWDFTKSTDGKNLHEATRIIQDKEIGTNETSRYYELLAGTLRRIKQSGTLTKLCLGPQGVFSVQKEIRLVRHNQLLESSKSAPDRSTVRWLKFQFAKKLGLKHEFKKKILLVGYAWLW